jgi:hypothetical protein
MGMDLTTAVTERRVLRFTYDGLDRVVQPATYGQTATGKWTLRACQVDGASNRNSVPCWELYTEGKMVDVASTDATFADFALPGYTRGDSAFVVIAAEH